MKNTIKELMTKTSVFLILSLALLPAIGEAISDELDIVDLADLKLKKIEF